jgi:predicted  nucleic acid-binding Zn-ribbon protein
MKYIKFIILAAVLWWLYTLHPHLAGAALLAIVAWAVYRETPHGVRRRIARLEGKIVCLEGDIEGYAQEAADNRLALERYRERFPDGVPPSEDAEARRTISDYEMAIAAAEEDLSIARRRLDQAHGKIAALRRRSTARPNPLLDH